MCLVAVSAIYRRPSHTISSLWPYLSPLGPHISDLLKLQHSDTRVSNNRSLTYLDISPDLHNELFNILRQWALYENILHINNISMRQPRTQTQAQGSAVISVLSTYTCHNRLSFLCSRGREGKFRLFISYLH